MENRYKPSYNNLLKQSADLDGEEGMPILKGNPSSLFEADRIKYEDLMTDFARQDATDRNLRTIFNDPNRHADGIHMLDQLFIREYEERDPYRNIL